MAKIFLVEDDTDYASVIVKVLGSMGHTVEVETNPARAVERLKEEMPDMILLDVMFPEDSFAGLELARSLNADPEFKGIPILLLTAVNEKYSMGFSNLDIDNSFFPVSDFLDKSVDLDVLKAKVTKMLEEKGNAQ
jgi:CheY-like chemotaxis protein